MVRKSYNSKLWEYLVHFVREKSSFRSALFSCPCHFTSFVIYPTAGHGRVQPSYFLSVLSNDLYLSRQVRAKITYVKRRPI